MKRAKRRIKNVKREANIMWDLETGCLLIDLRELPSIHRLKYKQVLNNYPHLDIKLYEKNVYYIFIQTEGDWESVVKLSTELEKLA